MADRLWHFLINSFLVSTLNSYRAMRKIGNFTLSALNVPLNATLLAQYTRLLPFVTDFNAKYAAWILSLGVELSSTNSLYVEMQLLSSTFIRTWDVEVQILFDIKSATYKLLFPKRRKPFQSGSNGDKLAALQALALAMTGIVSLATILADINLKITTIQGLMTASSSKKSMANTASTNVEASRVALGQEMYGVLGQMMDYLRHTPETIADYFDISSIRRLEQTLWRRTVKATKTVYIFTRTLAAGDTLHLVNLGFEELRFAFVATKGGLITTTFVTVPPLTSASVLRSAMGDMANRFCVVENMSSSGTGKYMLVLV